MTVKERKERIGVTIGTLAAVEESFRQMQETEPDNITVTLVIRALRIAGAELQQRIPEPPKRIRSARYSNKIGDCPFCGRMVDFESDYCKRCGRALDWTGDENGQVR